MVEGAILECAVEVHVRFKRRWGDGHLLEVVDHLPDGLLALLHQLARLLRGITRFQGLNARHAFLLSHSLHDNAIRTRFRRYIPTASPERRHRLKAVGSTGRPASRGPPLCNGPRPR